MSKTIPLAAVLLFSSHSALAAEHDFFIFFENCKATFAPLHLAEEPIVTADGDPVVLACTRTSGKMQCELQVEGTVTQQVYEIVVDIPPLLAFSTEGGGDFVSIQTTNHAAVLLSRMARTDMLGAKICHGTFATAQELESLSEAEEESSPQ